MIISAAVLPEATGRSHLVANHSSIEIVRLTMAYSFEAQVRSDLGKGASRRLRRDEKIPAVVYGAGQEAVSVVVDFNKITVAQAFDSFYSETITLVIDGKEVAVKVAAVQRHPVKPKVVHLDFVRV
jgi:large subunit ribosomal protein L25